jgi:hypothetical protein
MVFDILTSQLSVEVTTVVTLLLTIFLAAVMTKRYMKRKSVSLMYWSTAIWIFALGVFIEIVFAYGIYSQDLIRSYLFLVAVLVELLALGSMQLVKNRNAKKVYNVFVILSTLLLAYSLMISNIGNIITDYVVFGLLPISVVITSSIITFPAAIILIAVAVKSYLVKRSSKLLSIIAGVIIVSIAGTLYIVQYPAFLYIAEFVGILALWYGFV